MANADAHADATAVEITYAAGDERLELTVADDGAGFDLENAPGVEDGHLGLTVMRERARGHGGECTITSTPGKGTRRHSMDSALDSAFPGGACPHVAMLLSTTKEVAPTLASFYALGAKRNGWLFHRSLAGRADADRASLAAAGLDVAALEAAGQMVFREIDLDITVEDYVHAWEPELEAALAGGFDAAWWARFPIGPDAVDHRPLGRVRPRLGRALPRPPVRLAVPVHRRRPRPRPPRGPDRAHARHSAVRVMNS